MKSGHLQLQNVSWKVAWNLSWKTVGAFELRFWGRGAATVHQKFHGIFHDNFHARFQEKVSRQHFCTRAAHPAEMTHTHRVCVCVWEDCLLGTFPSQRSTDAQGLWLGEWLSIVSLSVVPPLPGVGGPVQKDKDEDSVRQLASCPTCFPAANCNFRIILGVSYRKIMGEPKGLVAPYCAIPRDYLSDTPLLRAMGFLVSQHGQLGAIPPPPFLSVSPLEYMRNRGAITPPQKGYLSDTSAIPSENKAHGCDTPFCGTISKGYCAIWGYLALGR